MTFGFFFSQACYFFATTFLLRCNVAAKIQKKKKRDAGFFFGELIKYFTKYSIVNPKCSAAYIYMLELSSSLCRAVIFESIFTRIMGFG